MKVQVKLVFLIIWIILFCSFTDQLFSQQNGYRFYKNYSYEEYEHQPQNWGMVQAPNGILYFANQGGVLEYDGETWRVIRLPNDATVRSIAIDRVGTVYVGGTNDFGYLVPDSVGRLQYASLRNKIKEDIANFSTVWSTHSTPKGIYFRTPYYLFRWDGSAIHTQTFKSPIVGMFQVGKELYIQKAWLGLFKMTGDKFIPITGGDVLKQIRKIVMVAPFDKRQLLICTKTKGFFLYDGKTVSPFHVSPAVAHFGGNSIQHGIRLDSGDYAFGTQKAGMFVMNKFGELQYAMGQNAGLQDNYVKAVFPDQQKNLWLCLINGISKIEHESPFQIYDKRAGLKSFVLCMSRIKETFYVGTYDGVYIRDENSQFKNLPGLSTACWSLLAVEDGVLAATSRGVYFWQGQNWSALHQSPSYRLTASRKRPGIIWVGAKEGLKILSETKENNTPKWTVKHFNGLTRENAPPIMSIAEDAVGTLWLGTETGHVFHITLYDDITHGKIVPYTQTHGIPPGQCVVSWSTDHIMLATTKGVMRHDQNNQRFIPDQTLGERFQASPNAPPIFRIMTDRDQHIWLYSQSRSYQAIPPFGLPHEIISALFLRIPLNAQVNGLFDDPQKPITWLATHKGLYAYDKKHKKAWKHNYSALIRQVMVNEKKLVYAGGRLPQPNQAPSPNPVFDYSERNLQFQCTATFYEAESQNRYRYLLDGYDNQWSGWMEDRKRRYTNLDAGQYVFRVQARNVYEHLGNEDSFPFRVLPPWYFTWWALTFYIILFFFSVYMLIKWRAQKLVREKLRLEGIVAQRTHELKLSNQQLEEHAARLQEQSAKLEELNRMKSHFFANISHEFRTPLTLIMSPLEQMQKESADKEKQEQLNLMMRNSHRLLMLIDQLLDLSRFDNGKMKYHAAKGDIIAFASGITATFQGLAHQNQIHLTFQSTVAELDIFFDRPKMEDVMYNLLINAFKFTPGGGSISVSVTRESQTKTVAAAEHAKISVSDTGIGISNKDIVHIFDRFYQADGLRGISHKGTGIGLALAKEIVTMHSGQIDVHSTEGKGTEVVVRLPMGHRLLAPAQQSGTPPNTIPHTPTPSPGSIKVDYRHILPLAASQLPAPESAPQNHIAGDAPSTGEAQANEKPVILVVEDDADVRKYILAPLAEQYTVIEAANGEEGIQKAMERLPDLIISDIMMPKVDGYQLCKTLREDIKTSHIPIILLTAKASEGSIVNGLETGVDDYITKPFNTTLLTARVKNLIDVRRQLHQKIQRQTILMPSETNVTPLDQQFLQQFRQTIEKNLADEDFTIDILYEALGMKRATFFKKIKALTGGTPNQFILSYRLERGAQLLKQKYGTVTDVAMAVGFSSPAYFSKCFKEKFQHSPSAFPTATRHKQDTDI